MKQLKRHCLMMLLLATICMTAACGSDRGTTNDNSANENNTAGMDSNEVSEGNSGNVGIDGRPFDEILFDTDGDGIYDHTDVDGDGLLEEIGRDSDDVVDDLVDGVTETGDTLMEGTDDAAAGNGSGEKATDAE